MRAFLSKLLPRTIFMQTLLVLLAGLAASQAISWWIYSSDRDRAVRETGGYAIAQRIANVLNLIEEAPAEWRPRIVAAVNAPGFAVALSKTQPAFPQGDDGSQAFASFLAAATGEAPDARQIVARTGSGEDFTPLRGPRFRDQDADGRERHMRGGPPWREGNERGRGPGWGGGGRHMQGFDRGARGMRSMQAALQLKSSEWLSVSTLAPVSASAPPAQFMLSFALMALTILAATAFAVRRLTQPLVTLSQAAQEVGRNLDAPPLQMSGSAETRKAAQAFNEMQTRLRALIDNRTRMLAAISHDLRTPLTSLRLRAENIADNAEREKMLANIAQMDQLIASALDFARDGAKSEPVSKVDVAALAQSVADDLADAGLDVQAQEMPPLEVFCRPAGLRRVIENLIGNAVKYGARARISAGRKGNHIWIAIDDDGPGIPAQDLERVFEPYVRLDESRDETTGGTGLGLAIVRSLLEAQGGRITLENREPADGQPGGLRATIILPQNAQR